VIVSKKTLFSDSSPKSRWQKLYIQKKQKHSEKNVKTQKLKILKRMSRSVKLKENTQKVIFSI
jgi:hypothetical protein